MAQTGMVQVSRPFIMTRWEVARTAAGEYVRSLWWLLAGIPVSGLFLVLLGGAGLLGQIGWVCLLWPVTIPLRAMTASVRAGALYGRPTTAWIDESFLYLRSERAAFRLNRSQIRDCRLGGGIWRIRTRRLSVLFLPDAALLGEDARENLRQIASNS